MHLTGALSAAVRDCPESLETNFMRSWTILRTAKPALATRRETSKLKNPQPPPIQQSVRFGGDFGGTKFFLGGWVALPCEKLLREILGLGGCF